MIVAVCALNIVSVTGRERQRPLTLLALADLGLQLAVIVVGALVVLHPDRLTDQLDLFTDPSFKDIVYAAGGRDARLRRDRGRLRPRARPRRRREDLKRVASVGALGGPAHLRGDGGDRADGGAGGRRPRRPADGARRRVRRGAGAGRRLRLRPGLARRRRCSWLVAAIAPPVLFWAASTSMLGLSRHVYVLATNRQIPSWLGKLDRRTATPVRRDRDQRR